MDFTNETLETFDRPDSDYAFEETDDPRTFSGSQSLLPDSATAPTYETYYRDFTLLLELLGKVAYNYKMKRNLEHDWPLVGQQKYAHDRYADNVVRWRDQSYRAYDALARTTAYFGLTPVDDLSRFLNSLLNADRRQSYRENLRLALKGHGVISVAQLEERFQLRLATRAKRSAKKKSAEASTPVASLIPD